MNNLNLRQLAIFQKWLLGIVLVPFIITFLIALIAPETILSLRSVFSVFGWVLFVGLVFVVYNIAIRLKDQTAWIYIVLLVIGSIPIPLLGFWGSLMSLTGLVLLNNKVSSFLTSRGAKVGLLGADLKTLPHG